MTAAPYGRLVAEHGFSQAQRLIVAAVPPASRVLDVGCASGYMARALAQQGCVVFGVEGNPAAAAQAREHCAEVVCGDVESEATRNAVEQLFAGGPPDVIVCGDVLEHLREPAATLTWLRGLLAPGGLAIVSLPNVGHWTARREIVRGRFPQHDHGLFDRTHLRWFTLASARELATAAGFEVVEEHHTEAPLPLESRLPRLGALRAVAVRNAPGLFALQTVLVLTVECRPTIAG